MSLAQMITQAPQLRQPPPRSNDQFFTVSADGNSTRGMALTQNPSLI